MLDASAAVLFDLGGAVIGVADDQQTFQVFDGLKFSRRRFDPVAAFFRTLGEGGDIDAVARFRTIPQERIELNSLTDLFKSIDDLGRCLAHSICP